MLVLKSRAGVSAPAFWRRAGASRRTGRDPLPLSRGHQAHGVWLVVSDTGCATAGWVAAALMLATSGPLASTERAELGRPALAGVERTLRGLGGVIRGAWMRVLGREHVLVLSRPVAAAWRVVRGRRFPLRKQVRRLEPGRAGRVSSASWRRGSSRSPHR